MVKNLSISLLDKLHVILSLILPQLLIKFSYKRFTTKQPLNDTLILEFMKDRKYWTRLKNTIEHFNLPIDIWSIGNAAY